MVLLGSVLRGRVWLLSGSHVCGVEVAHDAVGLVARLDHTTHDTVGVAAQHVDRYPLLTVKADPDGPAVHREPASTAEVAWSK